MRHPAFNTIPKALLYLSIFILAGAMIPLCLAGISDLKIKELIIQGIISGLIFCGISILLYFVTKFTNLKGNGPFQSILNHSALLLLAIIVWLGIEYFIFYIVFQKPTFELTIELIPFKVVINVLVFIIIILLYEKNSKSEVIDDDTDQLPEIQDNNNFAENNKIEKTDKITIKSGSNINIINVSDILYIQAEGDYIIIYTGSTRYIKEETMKHIEEQLPSDFIRIHRSCILNTNYLSRIELYEKQNYKITLKTGQQLKASAAGYKLLKKNLQL
jgi:hypothetical protein